MDWIDANHPLANAIGVKTQHDLDVVARTLSYLGISKSPFGSSNSHHSSLAVSLMTEASLEGIQACFDHDNKQWNLQQPQVLDSRTFNGIDRNSKSTDTVNTGDWTELLPSTPHVDFLKSRQWGQTTLGPMSSWPSPLRLMTMKMLYDPRPANLYVGADRVAVYNEPFSVIAGNRHPFMMGATCQAALPATWPVLSQIFSHIEETCEAFSAGEFELNVYKTGHVVEEAWYDGIFSPVKDENDHVFALYNSGFEVTDSVMSVRRSRILHSVSAEPDFNLVDPWQHVVTACDEFDRDIPLLILYSAIETSSSSPKCVLRLEGHLGVGSEHPEIPQELDLHEGSGDLVVALRQAKASNNHLSFEYSRDELPDFLAKDILWRGHGDPATQVVVAPLLVTGLLTGFLIMGLNPRRPYDDAHQRFVGDFVRVTTGLLTSNLSYEQARARETKLSEQLTLHEKFRSNVAEKVTVGICTQTHEGLITWANSKFWEVTGISNRPGDLRNMSGLDYIPTDVQDHAEKAFRDVIANQYTRTEEFPLEKKWRPPGSLKDEQVWVLVSMTGEPTSVMSCITDISHLKWSEKLQARIADNAKEAKRQQEKFMDMTSHELRNPLSAILQCADDILTSCQNQDVSSTTTNAIPEGIEESARTILFCAAHQQRIINDVLTVSKLDSSLLEISPTAMNASTVVNQALHMYKSELTLHNIAVYVTQEQSSFDLQSEYVYSDPSRLTQILVNLFTNAIKFTKNAVKREIHVRFSALKSPPSDLDRDLQWFPSHRERRASDAASEAEEADQLYLYFEVQDTGEGIPAGEMSQLFKRFSQTSPMTHVKYGGSGLGLFISRELTELQGGMVGAKSAPHRGTVFAFYIKTRIATPSEDQELRSHGHGAIHGNWMPSRLRRPSLRIEGIQSESKSTAKAVADTNSTETKPKKQKPSTSRATLSVLLVEDNILNQNILKRQLHRLGCTVYVANHGLEALDFLKTTRFWREGSNNGHDVDVVLMDWEMPVMDGLTSTRHLRDWERSGHLTKHLMVLGTTANARPEQVDIALAAGMDDVIAKPFTVTSLMNRIEALKS